MLILYTLKIVSHRNSLKFQCLGNPVNYEFTLIRHFSSSYTVIKTRKFGGMKTKWAWYQMFIKSCNYAYSSAICKYKHGDFVIY